MSPRRDTLAVLRTSFAGRDELIERAFRGNRSFRELCEHYVSCIAAIHHWQRAQAPGAVSRQQEYSELRDELGREIETWLEAMEAGSPRTNKEPM